MTARHQQLETEVKALDNNSGQLDQVQLLQRLDRVTCLRWIFEEKRLGRSFLFIEMFIKILLLL